MRAMLLAAGLGSRLKPLTDSVPKALLEVDGVPMLERVALRLREAGARELIVNAHHHAERVAAFAKAMGQRLGLRVEVSLEEELLGTGGGLKKAAWFFSGGGPFLVHNADVLSSIDLRRLYETQASSQSLATLAVMDRPTKRKLEFSAAGRLLGRAQALPTPGAAALGFSGVCSASPALLDRLTEEGAFSLIDAFLRLAGEGADLRAFRCDGSEWTDIGEPSRLAKLKNKA
ncbi:MAG: NTP transferase domain-containing protein [Elusimicrobia bacterium]|nr:NTP transferase domain-containing protein [Elusimicrobiota bacterium]MDE2237276.1 NTP transferase domain-containing protein [Elusimicrobiota bacterium]MDE2426651.1 NTP transferase domain-containing protein [Elusimicrobiota bacterium]